MEQPIYSVVQVTDQLNVGGAEQIIVMLANLLQQHGHYSAVITTVAPGKLSQKLHPAVEQINLNRRWKWNPLALYHLIKLLKSFDIIHVHSAYNLRYVYLASRLFFLRKTIFYHEHYGNAINTKPGFLQKRIYKQTIFIAVSQKLAEWAHNTVGLQNSRVFILPNTIVKSKITPVFQPADQLKLCIVGNILVNKNMLFALELLSLLREKNRSVHLTIIGNIIDRDYYAQLLNFIKQTDLQPNVSFIHNCLNVQALLHQFKAAIHCSFSESGPLVLIEYLAQGLPFVAHKTGEVATQLQSYLPAFIMNDFNVEKWIEAIEQATSLPKKEIETLFDFLYQKYFSPEAYYLRCVSIYKEGLLVCKANNIKSNLS
ncbi:MAG: glycosyltransferase family 4 protein [Ilyomonas sp.]